MNLHEKITLSILDSRGEIDDLGLENSTPYSVLSEHLPLLCHQISSSSSLLYLQPTSPAFEVKRINYYIVEKQRCWLV